MTQTVKEAEVEPTAGAGAGDHSSMMGPLAGVGGLVGASSALRAAREGPLHECGACGSGAGAGAGSGWHRGGRSAHASASASCCIMGLRPRPLPCHLCYLPTPRSSQRRLQFLGLFSDFLLYRRLQVHRCRPCYHRRSFSDHYPSPNLHTRRPLPGRHSPR